MTTTDGGALVMTRAEPDFENLLKVLRRETPDRPTLFEFFLNGPLYEKLAGPEVASREHEHQWALLMIHAFRNAGYDYVTCGGSNIRFPAGETAHLQTKSLNEGFVITDRATFEAYDWPDPESFSYEMLDDLAPELPDGMKFVVNGPGGVLENAISLVGYENLIFMLEEDPDLGREVFDAIGSRLVQHYRIAVQFPSVGAIISNDDWGFKTQTMLTPDQLRDLVFPWHRRIVATAHAAGKPAILHSCGNPREIIDDVIDDMAFDGRHSYEDAIVPVEEAYDLWSDRIAVMGGIDVDFVCRSTPEAVYRRSKAMLERAADKGSFALGTGNSVPEYVPDEQYFAMTRAALEER